MLRSIKTLHDYTIRALDGDIGRVHEFYFDDQSWLIRYLVADTGKWLPGRRVLLSPYSLGQPDWKGGVFPVELSKEQIENSPPISVDRPVSRQMETDLHAYYGWRPYWLGAPRGMLTALQAQAQKIATKEHEDDPNLRSTRQVIGYHIQATDGEIGHVEDFIADDERWTLHYMVVDTRNWLPGKRVLIAPAWVTKVDWVERLVYVNLRRETVKDSPEFDPAIPINREYEVRLYDYYGRPRYWERIQPENIQER